MYLTKYFLPICSMFMLAIGAMLIWQTDQERKITELNIIVTVQIIEAPLSCKEVTTRGGYCKLKYNEEIFGKKAGIKFCPLLEGKTDVNLLSNEEGTKLLFPEEYQSQDYIFATLLCLISVIIFLQGLKLPKIKQSKF